MPNTIAINKQVIVHTKKLIIHITLILSLVTHSNSTISLIKATVAQKLQHLTILILETFSCWLAYYLSS